MLVFSHSRALGGFEKLYERSSLGLTGGGLSLLDTAELHLLVLDVLLVSAALRLLLLDEFLLKNKQS